jgi:4-amino-4-deoxy-L-arabinose transferase-like glycosyltransferase
MSCARHLAFGYVDQPPLIALITKLALTLFGDSLYGLRFLPAVAAAATVAIAGRLTRRFGGGLWAQGIAMLGIGLSPFSLAIGNLLTMNAFEPLLWVGSAYLLAKAMETDRPRLWAAFGVVSGLGLINKYSMFFFLGSCIVGIALTPQRRALRRPGLALAALIAATIVAPTLAWQAQNGWPQLEVLRNAAIAKNIDEGPVLFYVQQLLLMSPLAAPLWLAGLYGLLFAPELRSWRWYGFTYLVLSVVYAALQAKIYYLAPAYTVLFAAGGAFVGARLHRIRFATVAYPALLLAGGLAIAPEAFPLLPLREFIAYQKLIDMRGVKMEKHPEGIVPQHFADMLGWNALVDTLARAYAALPPDQRHEAVILTRDYGQASAVDILGASRGLPLAISGHNNYYLYGTRGASGKVVLAIGLSREVARYRDPYVLPDFNNLPIYACTNPREPLTAFWPSLKRYI